MGRDVRSQRGLLRHRQLARPVTAPRAGAHLTGAATSDQRLVDVRHTDLKQPRRPTRGHAAVNRRTAPAPADPPNSSVPAATPSPPPNILRPANHTFSGFGIPPQRFQPMRLCSRSRCCGHGSDIFPISSGPFPAIQEREDRCFARAHRRSRCSRTLVVRGSRGPLYRSWPQQGAGLGLPALGNKLDHA